MPPPAAIVDLVQHISTRRSGRLFLANVLDSLHEDLVSDDFARTLLIDLQQETAAYPNDKWHNALFRVCTGANGASRGYLRSSKVTPTGAVADAESWTTIISRTSWEKWHCDMNAPSIKALGAFPRGPDATFTKKFTALINRMDWIKPGVHLGAPALPGSAQAGNCWLSCNSFDSAHPAAPSSVSGSARRIHEALGLEPTASSPLDSWIRYEIDVKAVQSALKLEAIRPNFADLGNSWFRVKSSSPRALAYAAAGWGSTVNLTVHRTRGSDDTGRPERVAPSIPISPQFICGVEWLTLAPRDRKSVRYPLSRFRRTRPFELRRAPLRAELLGRLWP